MSLFGPDVGPDYVCRYCRTPINSAMGHRVFCPRDTWFLQPEHRAGAEERERREITEIIELDARHSSERAALLRARR